MKNDRPVRRPEANGAFRMRLLMVCFLFIIGVLLGIFAHGIVTAQDNHLLQTYLLEFAQVGAGAEDRVAALLSVVTVYFRYPLLVAACGLVAAGLVLIPLLCLAQGAFLSFAVCCFASALGRTGVLLALAAFGVRCLITLPCTFFLAAQAMVRSYERLQTVKQKEKPHLLFDVRSVGKCFLILLIGVAVELTVVPKLLQLALARIS